VSVLVIDWTTIGAPPPTGTGPTNIWRVFFRGMDSEVRNSLSRGLRVRHLRKKFPISPLREIYSLTSFISDSKLPDYHRRDSGGLSRKRMTFWGFRHVGRTNPEQRSRKGSRRGGYLIGRCMEKRRRPSV
jgi:hypothetical protein